MDPFATLGIEREFDVDLARVERTHRELSRAVHPDRFAGAGASERRMALSRAADVNEAWRAVRDPIRRAESLFTLAGIAVGDTNEPKPDPELLMDMLEQREALAEAKAKKDMESVHALATAMEARAKESEAALAEGFRRGVKDPTSLAALLPKLGELRYLRRFLEEVSAIEEELDV